MQEDEESPEVLSPLKRRTPIVFQWVTMALLGMLILGVGALLVVSSQRLYRDWDALQQQSKDPKQKFDGSLELSKSIVGGIGTLATIAGGIVLYLNFRVANRNAEIANRNAQIAADNLKVSEDKQVTERFAKAVEQLGSDKVEVRLGAIYALERIARDSRKDHWTIIEILSAYARERSPREVEADSPSTDDEDKGPPKKTVTVDLQAVLTVIGRRKVEFDPEVAWVDLSNARLEGAKLLRANLQNVSFMGSALRSNYFWEANLKRSTFSGANLMGSSLSYADLRGAYLMNANLFGANLRGANLRGANLRDANLTKVQDWTDEQLSQAILCRTILPEGSKLDSDRDCPKPSPANNSTTPETPDVITHKGKEEGGVGED